MKLTHYVIVKLPTSKINVDIFADSPLMVLFILDIVVESWTINLCKMYRGKQLTVYHKCQDQSNKEQVHKEHCILPQDHCHLVISDCGNAETGTLVSAS